MQATQPELSKDLRLRRALASFLQEAGIKLHLPQTTIAFAIVLMHKHLSQLDIVSEHFILVQAILFVSSKVMETPVDIDMKYSALKMKVIEREQEVLRSIGFDLQEDHLPYKYLLNYLKTLHAKTNLAQASWNILSDSYLTPVCLKYPPNVIACSAIYLASKMVEKETLPEFLLDSQNYEKHLTWEKSGNFPRMEEKSGKKENKKMWWEVYGVKKFSEIEDISHQILDLYEDPEAANWRRVLI